MRSRDFKIKSKLILILVAFISQACGQQGSVNSNSGRRQGAAERKPVMPAGTTPSGSVSNGQGSVPVTPQELPAPSGLPVMRPVPGASVGYDFNGVLTRDSASASVVRMVLQKGTLSSARKVKVTGSLVNLRASNTTIAVDRDADVTAGGVIDFTVSGLAPDTVYRMNNVTITDISNASGQTAGQGGSVSVKDPYFLATTAAGSKLSQARRRLILETLSEAYDWDHDNYDGNKGYARGWGWCDAFYTWAASREFKVSRNYGSTSSFEDYNTLGNASKIPTIGVKENLAGDEIRYEGTREGTHTFMIVAWDVDTKTLWTVEGNFNRRVLRYQRHLNSPWMLGHLTEEMAR